MPVTMTLHQGDPTAISGVSLEDLGAGSGWAFTVSVPDKFGLLSARAVERT